MTPGGLLLGTLCPLTVGDREQSLGSGQVGGQHYVGVFALGNLKQLLDKRIGMSGSALGIGKVAPGCHCGRVRVW